MKDGDVVRITADLVNIHSESINDGEKEVAKYIHEYLQGLGIAASMSEFAPGRCNVTATIGSGEGLLLNGHIDTVPIGDRSKWTYGTGAKVVKGRMYGRGTSDMKGGVAAILASVAGLKTAKAKRRLVLAFVGDEEVSFKGSIWLTKNKKELFRNVKYGLIAEPTEMNLQIAQKGLAHITVRIKGKSAHGSMPWQGRNAIVEMSKFISMLDKFSGTLKVEDKFLGKGTINVGQIEGGTAINVVPDNCQVEIDRRLVPGETDKIALSQVRKILDSLNLDYEAKMEYSRPPFRLDEDSRIVRMLRGIVPGKLIGTTGYTEAELYKSMANIDCVVFGPGKLNVIHMPDENVSIADLEKSRDYYSKIEEKWIYGRD